MSRHEITNYGFVIVDNKSMTKPYNYDQTVIDNFFNITVRPPDKSAYQKIILLFLNQNICCGYSKEPSR